MRLCIRINDGVGARLAGLRPVLRAQVVGLVLETHVQGIDLGQLLATRRELIRVGTLINQSLRVSRGTLADSAAVQEVAQIILELTRK